jgi:two-component system, NarL family, nitrate/nitrite response regulator NarL
MMRLAIVTPIRILGEGLQACLGCRADVSLLAIVPDLAALRRSLDAGAPDVIVIDVTQGISLEEVRAVALARPDIGLLALGLSEQRHEVIRCGRAGFVSYVSRDASVDSLVQAIADVRAGRLRCNTEISSGLLRALFEMDGQGAAAASGTQLTRREGEVLHFLGRGMSNKEIARELNLSTATIKHHVHGVLRKLNMTRRTQVMRRMHEMPGIA